jgi:membrane-bound lytic murein transglycosylase D
MLSQRTAQATLRRRRGAAPRIVLAGALCALGLFGTACAARVPVAASPVKPVTVHTAVPTPTTAPAPIPQSDPVIDLIAASMRLFEAGQKELTDGHLEQAKTQFNRALEVLLESSYGARSEPRIREHFDRLVERISAYEVTALAQGDGFTEKKYEPASIDELLAISTFDQPTPTPETTQAVADDPTMHDIDIPLNAKVLSFVQLFSGRLKGYLEDGLSRGARFLPMIQDVFRAEGLPLDLAYVPLVESAFKPNALSHAKAKGIWQFMRGTALENGLDHDWYIDERADPEKATRAAAKYLKTLYGMFGDWHLALASYNGGPGRVQKAMKRSGSEDFWSLTSSTRFLPQETRDYVPLILAAVIIARNPAQYGMNIQPFETPRFEKVTLPKAIDLRRVAEWAGTPVQIIQDLNPELRRWTTPVRTKDYQLKVPEGTAAVVQARLAEAEADELAPLNRYSVRKGETLLSISRKLKVSRADLAEANYLSVKSRLSAGQQLIIPREPTLLLAARTETPVPETESRSLDAVVAVRAVAPRAEQASETKVVHKVKRGETLASIARLYRTSVASLKQWNRIKGNAIMVGQRLTVFGAKRTVATN